MELIFHQYFNQFLLSMQGSSEIYEGQAAFNTGAIHSMWAFSGYERYSFRQHG